MQTLKTPTARVCPVANSVTHCPVCHAVPLRPRQKTCSVACRVAKHRAASSRVQAERKRRESYNKIKNQDRYLTFDGRRAGQVPVWLGPFELFEVHRGN